jgi:hypothetical protein
LTFLVSSTVTIIEFGPHSIKIGGLVVKSWGRIIGQIFFNETTNAQRYQRLLGPFINELDGINKRIFPTRFSYSSHATNNSPLLET